MKNFYKKNIFITIPVYKVGKTISKTIKRIPEIVYNEIKEIVIVEDVNNPNEISSTPELLKEYPKSKVIYHEKNKGYGAAQKTGYKYCMQNNADVVVLLHSDGQYHPKYLEKFLKYILIENFDVVQGSRMMTPKLALKGGMPFWKYVLNKLTTQMENIIYKTHYTEFHSGYMGYSRKALKYIAFEKLSNKFHFDGEMLLMTKLKSLKFKQFPIETYYGEGTSSLNPISYGFQIMIVLYKYLINYYNFKVNIKRFDQ